MKSPAILDFPETSTRPLGLQAVGIESTLVFPILDVDGLSSAVLALHKSRICREMVPGFLAHIGAEPRIDQDYGRYAHSQSRPPRVVRIAETNQIWPS